MGVTGGKYFIKFNLNWHIWNINSAKFKEILSIFDFGNNWGIAIGKYLIKNHFLHQNRDVIFEISDVPNFYKFWVLIFRTNLGLTGGKYLIKIIFDIKIEIGIFEILDVPNFNKFWALLILGPIWAKEVVSI